MFIQGSDFSPPGFYCFSTAIPAQRVRPRRHHLGRFLPAAPFVAHSSLARPASVISLSAWGRGNAGFSAVADNTDVLFKLASDLRVATSTTISKRCFRFAFDM